MYGVAAGTEDDRFRPGEHFVQRRGEMRRRLRPGFVLVRNALPHEAGYRQIADYESRLACGQFLEDLLAVGVVNPIS